MATTDAFIQEIRELFKGQRVILIGDSIMRGIFKDIACLLTGHNRLLHTAELKFNRHLNRYQSIFGENIDQFHVNRTNSIYNIEKRTLQSMEFGYHVSYMFTSRIWNTEMEKLLISMKNYTIVILESGIWDLTRYGDSDGHIYLKNAEVCFSKLQQMANHVIWISTPPVDIEQHAHLSTILAKMNVSMIAKAQQQNFRVLELNQQLENNLNLRDNDGVHWTPEGHRLITRHLIEFIAQLPKEGNTAITDQRPVANERHDSQINLSHVIPPGNAARQYEWPPLVVI